MVRIFCECLWVKSLNFLMQQKGLLNQLFWCWNKWIFKERITYFGIKKHFVFFVFSEEKKKEREIK